MCNCVQNHPKLCVVDPLYEGQLIRKDLEHEKYNMNLFPQQDNPVGGVM